MGDVQVSGGALVRVVTGEIRLDADQMNTLGSQIDGWSGQLTFVWISSLPFGGSAIDGDGDLSRAIHRLQDANRLTDALAHELRQAAQNYDHAESAAHGASRTLAAMGSYEFGLLAPIVLFWIGTPLVVGAGGEWLASRVFPGLATMSTRTLARFVGSRRAMLSDPRFVAWVRAAVSSADEAMLGAAHVPSPVAMSADERGFGWFGLRGAAREAVTMGNAAGALRETPILVREASALPATPPNGYAELSARIPPSGPGRAQVRIEKYEVAGGRPRWILYVGGTVDTGFTAAGEPFDDTSNLQGIADLDPGSVRATRQAMADAGIERGDQVLSVGYSQGGIVATDIVTGGGYRNVGLITFGSPTGSVGVPDAVPNVAVEITEDMVPALDGYPRPADQSNRILVQRSAYDGKPPPAEQLATQSLPAHNIRNYQDTATLMDASTDNRLVGVRESILAFTNGADGVAEMWRADRE